MRLTILFFSACTIALLTFASKSSATDKGLSYTTLGATNQTAAAPKLINLKTIQPATPITHNEPAKNSPMAEVWTKYKELATGQASEAQTSKGQASEAKPKPVAAAPTTQKISTPQKPTITKPTLATSGNQSSPPQSKQKKTGLAGIIENFQDNKDLSLIHI